MKYIGMVLLSSLLVSGCFEDGAAKRMHEQDMARFETQKQSTELQMKQLEFEKHKFDKLAELCALFLENNAGKGTGCNFR